MKTVFKKGMKVYDQLIFPDKEGIVLTTNYIPEKIFDEDDFDENYVHPYPIEVEFGSETMLYTSDGDSWICGLKTLSTKPYKVELQDFEQKAPAPTYEEAEEWIRKEYEKGNNYLMLKNTFEALRKLTILREYYNKGWQPDWSTVTWKYFIIVRRVYPIVEFEVDCSAGIPHVLSFKTRDIAKKFLEEQRELLEIAKPLL